VDGFIIRIYHREHNNVLVGIAEDVEQGRSRPFRSAEELWQILQRQKPAKGKIHLNRKGKKTGRLG
jgi:hypothetical protein